MAELADMVADRPIWPNALNLDNILVCKKIQNLAVRQKFAEIQQFIFLTSSVKLYVRQK